MSAILVEDLHHSYGAHTVVAGLDLRVDEGTIHALLGPNGAGKTTVVRILSTLVTPDAGHVRVGGHDLATDPEGVRAAIGVTGQFSAVDGLLTGAENLRLIADLRHLGRTATRRRVPELLERFELVEAADRAASTYSGGMRRRLDLAMTLLGDPRIVFLDEPTTGLDPRSRRDLWDAVRELVARGVTILLTTQYLEEADQLADRVGVLDGGRLVAEGSPTQLKQRTPGGHVRLRFADADALSRAEAEIDGTPDPAELALDVPSDGSPRALRALLDRYDDGDLVGVSVHTPDLDDVFLALTGRAREETPA
ncbi:ABC transporter ATP-binding protein [Actinomycetospora sp. NBC_00405]|uniref:ABC transporter ATP-binding protein n=1 Tax=Actinomycetospora sp. NBC_00405 TaxID=2975952 RepID=UPI002E20A504